MAELLRELGRSSLEIFWLPVALWSVLAMVVYLSLRAKRGTSVYQYHGRASLLLALPVGLVASVFASHLHEAMVTAQSELSAKFIIIESPIFMDAAAETAAFAVTHWSHPQVWIGVLFCVILTGALVSIGRVLLEWYSLRHFSKSLHTHSLTRFYRPGLKGFSKIRRVRLAFSHDTEIPFTFGWINPVVVLPEFLRDLEEKRYMAIKHELIHIRHSDFALNGFLMIVRSLFWFHPLVHLLQREIQEFREISCDREVISGGNVSPRKYAELLFELAPKQVFRPRVPINMAVHPHLLKRRIRYMKSHESASRSHRSSLIMTAVTAVFVTGIMACTDLQRVDTGEAELVGDQLLLNNATIVIDGVPFLAQRAGLTAEGPISGIAALSLGDYGTFVFSGESFDGAAPTARIDGNTMELTVNSHNVVIRSEGNILSVEEADLWVAHDPDFVVPADSADGPVIHTYWAAEYTQYEEHRALHLDNPGETSETEYNVFFQAVQEEPRLIGGLRQLQEQVEYPLKARRAGVEGIVIVRFIVSETGQVVNPEVVRGIGGGCDEAAVAAVRKAQFEPGRQKGEAVPVQFSLPITFRLMSEDASSGFLDPSVDELRNAAGMALNEKGSAKDNYPPPPPRPIKD